MQPKALPGFRDFYPADLALRAHIFGTWRAVAARYGFEEYDGPPLEPLELYTAKSGDEIVGQLYTFTDRGERDFVVQSLSESCLWLSDTHILLVDVDGNRFEITDRYALDPTSQERLSTVL